MNDVPIPPKPDSAITPTTMKENYPRKDRQPSNTPFTMTTPRKQRYPSKTPHVKSWPPPKKKKVMLNKVTKEKRKKLRSIDDVPAQWSISLSIDSQDWLQLTWYRWYFDRNAEMMMSLTLEWCLRRFWKIEMEP